MIHAIFEWFNEEKLLKRFQGLRASAERIAGDMAAQLAAEKLTVEALHSIREEAISTRTVLEALVDLARQHETRLGVVIGQQLEQVELMDTTRKQHIDYVDKVNDAATLAANAGDYLLSSPESAAKLAAGFNHKVWKAAFDILADKEDWGTIALFFDLAKDKLDGK